MGQIKITYAEKIILENMNKNTLWIARDENGTLWTFDKKPYKKKDEDEGFWWADDETNYYHIAAHEHLFQFIKWKDEEPYYIPKIIAVCNTINSIKDRKLIDTKILFEKMDERYKEVKDIVPDNLVEGFVQMQKLIKEQPDNSIGFKHFKLHSKSTLKTLKKDELIDYIYMVYGNWQGADLSCENAIRYNYQLADEIEKLKNQLVEFNSSETRDNPPLKFEEIKEGMWVWDNKIKQYYKISCVYKDNGILVTDGFMNKFILFEENRFYRKQVLYE